MSQSKSVESFQVNSETIADEEKMRESIKVW